VLSSEFVSPNFRVTRTAALEAAAPSVSPFHFCINNGFHTRHLTIILYPFAALIREWIPSEGVENEAVEQVCFADKVLLNKTDLFDEAKLTEIEAGLL